ncbi:hypothetical protein Tco_0511590 [Tanacetum coccineum]
MIDNALWEVIKNVATLPKTTTMEGVVTVMPITTVEEKAPRRLEVKARSTLMMGILNEHQLRFNFIKDAKKLLEAVKKRFGFKILNKADLDTMSMDDLYKNLKVYEPEVKGMSSSSSSTLHVAFVSSSNNNTSITNEAVNTAHGVFTASTQVNAVNFTNIDNLSDVVICAFFTSQPNSPQLVPEDLQQIHPDNMEEIDLRWKMPMLTMRARMECKALRYQDNKNKESSKRSVLVETSTSMALVSCDGLGLKSVEENFEVYKANKSIYLQDIKGLKFEIHLGEIAIRELRKNLEIVQKEKDSIQLNVDKFEQASKSLNKLIECQIVDNCKKVRKNDDAPIIEEWVSDDEEEDVSQPKIEKKIVRPSIVKKEFVKSKQQEKTARKTVKQIEQHRQNTHSSRGNQIN